MKRNVLVVGSGPTGLMAAACLKRHGVDVRLIDRATTPPDDRSRAAVVQPRTLEAFDNLGIADEALAAGLMVNSLELYSPSGSRGTLTFTETGWLDSRYDRLLSLPQDQTERILTEFVERSGVVIERGVELVGLIQGDSSITATLKSPDGTEEFEAGWIFGADGSHSAVRSLSGLEFPGATYPDEGLIGDIVVDWDLSHDEVSLCPQRDGFLLVFPLPGDKHFRTIMILPNPTMSEDRHLGIEEFQSRLGDMTPKGRGFNGGPPRIIQARWLTRYRLHRRGVRSYQKGRAFVGGDAAHIHSPVGAQGMNTGIQDAYNLAWKIALVARGEAPAWLVDTYDGERRHIGELLLNGTDRAFGFVAGHGLVSRTVRRIAPTIGARALGLPFIARRLVRFVSQLGIKYRRSRLSVEGPHAGRLGRNAPMAGDRAPDAGGGTRRLFDEMRDPMHHLLVFKGDASAEAVERSMAGVSRFVSLVKVVRIEAGEEIHDKYGARHGALYLIRPDGYIGFRGTLDDAEALTADLHRRFVVA
jgi:2-polyprenyl-6-methoxyphenol hydroxylase-like FAD-dependent oxidoreductase